MVGDGRPRGRPKGPGVDVPRRRAELLDAAERAIRDRGAGISMGDVAAEAGYARSAVYAAFAGRAALLGALSERHAELILTGMMERAAAASDPRVQFRDMLDVLFAWAQERPRLYWALIRPPDESRPGLFDLLAGSVEAMLRPVLESAGADADLAAPGARAMMGSAIAAVEWWLRSGTAMPRATLVGYLADLAWGGGVALPPGWHGVPVRRP